MGAARPAAVRLPAVILGLPCDSQAVGEAALAADLTSASPNSNDSSSGFDENVFLEGTHGC